MAPGENGPILTVNRPKAKLLFAILFGLGLFCSVGIAWTLVRDFHHSTTSLAKTAIFSFLLIVFVPYTVYNFYMMIARRFVLEVNEKGVKVGNDRTISWDSIYMIELHVFPSGGQDFLYHLQLPRAFGFYRVVIYEDYLLKKKSSIRFTSHITTTIDKINEALSYYTIKNNILFNGD